MPRMRSFDSIAHCVVEIHRLENDGDRVSREAVASLFEAGIDPMVVIRWKDVFDRLEGAIDAAEHVADVLEGVVIKNACEARGQRPHPRHRRRPALLRLHQRLPRHGERHRATVSTRAMSPSRRGPMAAVLNFVGAFISCRSRRPSPAASSMPARHHDVVFAGLIGAIAWNLATWCAGLP